VTTSRERLGRKGTKKKKPSKKLGGPQKRIGGKKVNNCIDKIEGRARTGGSLTQRLVGVVEGRLKVFEKNMKTSDAENKGR